MIYTTDIYEGTEPFLFISYSHKNASEIKEVCTFLQKNGVRFWYDDGLKSGNDWNAVIASHIYNASSFLLLLSADSASSKFVKDELAFAANHGIPIHAVKLQDFTLPIDIELPLSSVHILNSFKGNEEKLLRDLPAEIFYDFLSDAESDSEVFHHPLFTMNHLLLKRQGTLFHLGTHRNLNYDVLIQEDRVINPNASLEQARITANLTHPLFPELYDAFILNNRLFTITRYDNIILFPYEYLKGKTFQEENIIRQISAFTDALDYLFTQDLGLRDPVRGNLLMKQDGDIGFCRLQSTYYGVVKLNAENRQSFLEREMDAVAFLLFLLCTGRYPVLPYQFLDKNSFSEQFTDHVNLILQKCSGDNQSERYSSFREITADLTKKNLSDEDLAFLNMRREKIKEYGHSINAKTDYIFTFNVDDEGKAKSPLSQDYLCEPFPSHKDHRKSQLIRIKNCYSNKILEFRKNQILVGRSETNDIVLNLPYISGTHLKISIRPDGGYEVEDLNSRNGAFRFPANEILKPGKKVRFEKNECVRAGGVILQLL